MGEPSGSRKEERLILKVEFANIVNKEIVSWR